jgi:HEAT repeat protein
MSDPLDAERVLAVLDKNTVGNEEGRRAKKTLIEMGDHALPTLLKCIAIGEIGGEFNAVTQLEASVILARIGGDQVIHGLIDLLDACARDNLGTKDRFTAGRDADIRRKVNIARALADIDGARGAVEPLRLLLKDRATNVRAGAMMALARTQDPQVIEILASILDKETDTVYFAPREDFRQAEDFPNALKAPERVGPTAIDALTQAAEKCWPYRKKEVLTIIENLRLEKEVRRSGYGILVVTDLPQADTICSFLKGQSIDCAAVKERGNTFDDDRCWEIILLKRSDESRTKRALSENFTCVAAWQSNDLRTARMVGSAQPRDRVLRSPFRRRLQDPL